MFWRMIASVRREWPISQGSRERSSVMSAMSAVSIAASLPAAPMAMPKLARAMAGASLTPSPTMATVPYFVTSASTAATLSSGRSSAWTSSMPISRAIASAVARLSPVSMIRCSMPRARRSRDHARSLRPHGVGDGDQAADVPLVADHHDRPSGLLERGRPVGDLAALLAALLEVAVRAQPVGRAAEAADDALALKDAHVLGGRHLDAASRRVLDDRSWRAGARCGPRAPPRARGAPPRCARSTGTTSTTAGSPRVSVPVLSKAMALSPAGCST